MTRDEWRPDLEAVFEHYGSRIFPSSGQWAKALCPLLSHDDRNPSASVNVDAGKWSCFSCGGRGDALDIIQANEESCAGFTDALQFAKDNFADGGGAVRGQRGSGGRLSLGPPTRKKSRRYSPPWRLS